MLRVVVTSSFLLGQGYRFDNPSVDILKLAGQYGSGAEGEIVAVFSDDEVICSAVCVETDEGIEYITQCECD